VLVEFCWSAAAVVADSVAAVELLSVPASSGWLQPDRSKSWGSNRIARAEMRNNIDGGSGAAGCIAGQTAIRRLTCVADVI
jgi:hypothetical protein